MTMGPVGGHSGSAVGHSGQPVARRGQEGRTHRPRPRSLRRLADAHGRRFRPAASCRFAGLGGVEKQLGEPIKAGIREALKRTGFSVIQELPEELVTTLGQQLNDQQFGVRELTYDSAKQAAMDTALTVLGTVGLVGAAQYRRGGPTSPVGTTSGATPVETAPAQNDAPTPMEDEGFEVTDIRGLSEGSSAQPFCPAAPCPDVPPDRADQPAHHADTGTAAGRGDGSRSDRGHRESRGRSGGGSAVAGVDSRNRSRSRIRGRPSASASTRSARSG
jgi:hypothetical protein